jgi:hypothetical protein
MFTAVEDTQGRDTVRGEEDDKKIGMPMEAIGEDVRCSMPWDIQ